ncbi:hypothetical protein ACVMFA_007317 [Bradyrhizobium liaoningense]|uniref:hypothetical protein n=1 Tax=Bradyrhizobium liaoningense TaxID=43992 RepID=UPI0024E122CD|nr:hypothetical protein [Bradyrhizobium liaoningense]
MDDDRCIALRCLARDFGAKAGNLRRHVGSVFRRFAVCDCEEKLQHALFLKDIQQLFYHRSERQIVGYELVVQPVAGRLVDEARDLVRIEGVGQLLGQRSDIDTRQARHSIRFLRSYDALQASFVLNPELSIMQV